MPFDLDPFGEEVEEIRSSYAENPDPSDIARTAHQVQEEYVDGVSAAIGGITTLEGVQSTKTRRPISASYDSIVESRDQIAALGEEYEESWSIGGAYFASVNDIEVAVIIRDEFEQFEFPYSILQNSYDQEVLGPPLQVAEPESNFVSKFNRSLETQRGESGVVKGSDIIDVASHLHWGMKTGHTDFERMADMTRELVEPPYYPALDAVREAEPNFSDEERDELERAVNAFSFELFSGDSG